MNSCFVSRPFCSRFRALSFLAVAAWPGIALADAEPTAKSITATGVIPVVVRVELGSGAAAPTAVVPSAGQLSSKDLQQAIAAFIDNSAVKVQVLSLGRDQKPTIFISGKVRETAREHARNAAKHFVPDFAAKVIEQFEDEPGAPGAPPPPKTEVWPLTFIDSSLKKAEADKQYEVAAMVEALNALYGSEDGDKPIQVTRNSLLLRGDEDTLRGIKRQLVLLDAPGPQVQLDMWAIQISGKRGKEYSKVLSEIADDVRATQAALRLVPGLIRFQGNDFKFAESDKTKEALADLEELGFDTNPERHMSLNERFIFMGLADKKVRDRILSEIRRAFRKNPASQEVNSLAELWEKNEPTWRERYRYETGLLLPHTGLVFSSFTESELLRDQKAIADFARSAVAFNREQTQDEDKDADRIAAEPSRLRSRAATADALFKIATDAFTRDMQEMFLEPLLQRIVQKQRSGAIKGVSLVGRSRLVVTSGLSTSLQPEVSAYVNTTRPVPLTEAILDKAFPAGTSSTSSDENALTGVASVLAKLPAAQAIALAAALNPPKSTFTEVAPGIGIEVRPAVLPDGGSARLQVNMHFGVTATAFAGNEAEKDGLSYPSADAVKSHQVATDAIVSAFDLFDISSFDISTTYPRPPGSVPILGTLPLIGPAFQWRRKATELEHHSLILVNTVILPRALNLTQFYGGNP